MSSGFDSVLLEDQTPLIVKGMQVAPSATNRFKKATRWSMYTEIYEPLLASDKPPKVVFAYHVLDRATNKELMFTGGMPAEEFIQKGNPVIPAGLRVEVGVQFGSTRWCQDNVDTANNDARIGRVDFDVTDWPQRLTRRFGNEAPQHEPTIRRALRQPAHKVGTSQSRMVHTPAIYSPRRTCCCRSRRIP